MIRIASYNMRRLFSNRGSSGKSVPKSDNEILALIRAVDSLRADVLAAQEVESQAALQRLNERLREPYPYAELIESNSTRSLHLAFLSRFPFQLASHRQRVLTDEAGCELTDYLDRQARDSGRSTPLRFQRDCLVARFDGLGEDALTVVNLHLKSQGHYSWLKHEPAAIRAAEARAVADILSDVTSTGGAESLVLLGDLNDRTDSRALAPLTSGMGFHDPLAVEIEARGQDAHTFHGAGGRARLDYILLSPAAAERYREGSVRIHRSRTARRASDHYPVSLELG